MLLSILIPGKNDSFRENVQKTLSFNLNKTISNINKLGVDDIELVVCDWGSDEKILTNIITEKCNNLKYVYVDKDICKKYNGDSNYSIVHPINTAFRQSEGEYVIFWDSDCYVTYENFCKLYEAVKKIKESNDMKFYWGSRYNVPMENYINYTHFEELEEHFKNNVYTKQMPIDTANFRGCTISLLMNRKIWEESTGWWEVLTKWGWQDIEFHNRLATRYKFGGDLDQFGAIFYHLTYTGSKANTQLNPCINSPVFNANGEIWGLSNEILDVKEFKVSKIKNSLIKKIVELSYKSKEGHLGSSLSVLDILFILYKNIIVDFDNEDRNRFIFSKGHGSLGLYAVLDYFELLETNIETFCKFDSILGGHPSNRLKNVEVPTGSLGHGLPIGVGMAMGYKARAFKNKIYVMVGDGEMNEGSNWEAILLAANHNLNNLVCIMDYNRSNDRALKLDSVKDKLLSFNWDVIEVDGHNASKIEDCLNCNSDKPIFIIANTVKGKGISFMENNPEWHHKSPNELEYNEILKLLY